MNKSAIRDALSTISLMTERAKDLREARDRLVTIRTICESTMQKLTDETGEGHERRPR